MSDALYLLSTLCATNWLGLPCDRSAAAALCSSCGCAPAAQTGIDYADSGPLLYRDACAGPGNCSVAMSNWVYDEGCCASVAAAAEARRAAVATGNPVLGKRFRAAWGGGRVSEFQSADACSAGASWMDPACLASECKLGGSVWPSVCCTPAAASCANGAPAYPGACTCSCPSGWTGPRCDRRVPHTRVGIRARGMTRRGWLLSHTAALGFVAVLGKLAGVPASAVEVDTFKPAVGKELTVRRSSAAAVLDGLDLDVRVLCESAAQVTPRNRQWRN